MRKVGLVESAEFNCQHGVTAETAPAIQAEAIAKLPGGKEQAEASAKQKDEMEAQGRAAWEQIHRAAIKGLLTEEWVDKWEEHIPSYWCQCRAKFKAIRKVIPLRPDDQFGTTVEWHNEVSAELNPPKPQLTVEEAYAIWSNPPAVASSPDSAT